MNELIFIVFFFNSHFEFDIQQKDLLIYEYNRYQYESCAHRYNNCLITRILSGSTVECFMEFSSEMPFLCVQDRYHSCPKKRRNSVCGY